MRITLRAQPTHHTGGWQRLLVSLPMRMLLLLICFLWTLPTVGLFISSFRTEAALEAGGWWFLFVHPFEMTHYTLANYQHVLLAEGLGTAFLNSLLVTLPAVVLPVTFAAFAAYAFAWLRFPGRNLCFALVVGAMVLPLHVALIPLQRIYALINLDGTYLGIWLAHTAFGMPLAIYLLYSHIATLPGELIESARLDGASPFATFTTLVLPLSLPAIAAFATFQFLWVWNDLLVALVLLGSNGEAPLLTTHLTALAGTGQPAWGVLAAGACISMLVPLALFFGLQRPFLRSITVGVER